jgi:hypothetical protein
MTALARTGSCKQQPVLSLEMATHINKQATLAVITIWEWVSIDA